MYNFIVTGAAGYIGSHMCVELRERYPDCHIIGIDRKLDLRLLDAKIIDAFDQVDLTEPPTDYRYDDADCVFHFAADASVSEGEKHRLQYYHNNVGCTLGLLKWLGGTFNNLIFSSTAAVYGNPIYTPIDEHHPREPVNVYGRSKKLVEDILLDLQDPHMNVGILRYFNAAGRNVKYGLKEEHDPETHLIPSVTRGKSANIYGNRWGTLDGTAIRDYIHVQDLCRAHSLTFEHMEKVDHGIVLNVGTGIGTSVKEVIDLTEKVFDCKIERKIEPVRHGDVGTLVADVRKMKETLHFEPHHDMIDIIRSMIGG